MEAENWIGVNLLKMQLKQLRTSAHMSQQELSEKAGISISTIHAIETTDVSRMPTIDSIVKYVTALNGEIYIKSIYSKD